MKRGPTPKSLLERFEEKYITDRRDSSARWQTQRHRGQLRRIAFLSGAHQERSTLEGAQ